MEGGCQKATGPSQTKKRDKTTCRGEVKRGRGGGQGWEGVCVKKDASQPERPLCGHSVVSLVGLVGEVLTWGSFLGDFWGFEGFEVGGMVDGWWEAVDGGWTAPSLVPGLVPYQG